MTQKVVLVLLCLAVLAVAAVDVYLFNFGVIK